ncbi:hypothetical protein Tco_0618553 [Tanacetum coccineum]
MSTQCLFCNRFSTQADEAQSSRVPVPLPEDPYEAIRQAYLDGTDTKSEPFEDPIETETLESPHTIAPPTSLFESTSSTLVLILRKTARMDVRVPPEMSSGLSASMAVVAAMSEFAFYKRFRSSYESSPSSSPPNLLSRKRYQGTSELVEEDEEDEEIEKILDSNNVSEDAEDDGPIVEDEDPAAGDEGLAAGDEGLGDAIPEGQQRAVSVRGQPSELALGLGMGYETRVLAFEGASPVRTPSLTRVVVWVHFRFSAPSIVPSPISSPMIPLTVPFLVATPATVETEGFLTELGAQVKMLGGLICDHAVRLEELSPALFERYGRDIRELFTRSGAVRDEIFSQRYRFRSLEHEQERVAVTFGALWRPVLALESWACQTDAHRAALWHAISDTQGENQELRLQLAEERRAQLELAEIVDSMR